ncbi:DUF2939 domain-containing protein [Lichenifustis flavocetrariae]|uniref:DUF2939 domain-containing protein n=1 Tax=Lichenifustis flavocetrariae TaxID=2949735 RepID=A0AA41YRV9_9HYPH|nr:DUF2939 domain-containing protein [Lichenifustis flavocetrariae]MCW6507044.1 DUF2939 domain-containing protein [Lichenifustis flavocetrariae]
MIVVAVAYWLWPYAGAYELAEAAAMHDAEALTQRINAPALKRSLARQIVSAYLKKSGRADKMGGWQRSLATSVGATLADPYLNQLLAPDALATLLAQGRIGQITIENRTVAIDRSVPTLQSIYAAHFIHVLFSSYFDGLASFRFSVPTERQGGEQDYGIHLRLSGLTWRLSGIDLPDDVLDRIASDAIAAEKRPSKEGT